MENNTNSSVETFDSVYYMKHISGRVHLWDGFYYSKEGNHSHGYRRELETVTFITQADKDYDHNLSLFYVILSLTFVISFLFFSIFYGSKVVSFTLDNKSEQQHNHRCTESDDDGSSSDGMTEPLKTAMAKYLSPKRRLSVTFADSNDYRSSQSSEQDLGNSLSYQPFSVEGANISYIDRLSNKERRGVGYSLHTIHHQKVPVDTRKLPTPVPEIVENQFGVESMMNKNRSTALKNQMLRDKDLSMSDFTLGSASFSSISEGLYALDELVGGGHDFISHSISKDFSSIPEHIQKTNFGNS